MPTAEFEIEIMPVNDDLTCDECRRISEKTYDLADAPKPPFHDGCRCIATVTLV